MWDTQTLGKVWKKKSIEFISPGRHSAVFKKPCSTEGMSKWASGTAHPADTQASAHPPFSPILNGMDQLRIGTQHLSDGTAFARGTWRLEGSGTTHPCPSTVISYCCACIKPPQLSLLTNEKTIQPSVFIDKLWERNLGNIFIPPTLGTYRTYREIYHHIMIPIMQSEADKISIITSLTSAQNCGGFQAFFCKKKNLQSSFNILNMEQELPPLPIHKHLQYISFLHSSLIPTPLLFRHLNSSHRSTSAQVFISCLIRAHQPQATLMTLLFWMTKALLGNQPSEGLPDPIAHVPATKP